MTAQIFLYLIYFSICANNEELNAFDRISSQQILVWQLSFYFKIPAPASIYILMLFLRGEGSIFLMRWVSCFGAFVCKFPLFWLFFVFGNG